MLACEVVAPSEIAPGIPPELEEITLRMLNKEPSERFARCQDVAKALKKYIDSVPKDAFDEADDNSGGNIVADYVETLMGEELKSRVSDLTPSQANFMINLTGEATGGSTIEYEFEDEEEGQPWLPVALGIMLVLVLAGIGGGGYWWYTTQNQAKTAAAQIQNEVYVKGPKGAIIFIDNKKWPKSAPTVLKNLSLGKHEIRLELAGKKPISRTIDVKKGGNLLIDPDAEANPIKVTITLNPLGQPF